MPEQFLANFGELFSAKEKEMLKGIALVHGVTNIESIVWREDLKVYGDWVLSGKIRTRKLVSLRMLTDEPLNVASLDSWPFNSCLWRLFTTVREVRRAVKESDISKRP